MKKVIILFLSASPFFCFGQIIKKATLGGILVESLDHQFEWSQDFRLTLNASAKKSNHHLILKKNVVQTSNALEFDWGEPYLFLSKNLNSQKAYLGLGIQKGVPIQKVGSVIFFFELGTSFPTKSLSFGVAIHPQLIIWKTKKSP